LRVTGRQVASLALHEEVPEALPDVGVDLVEFAIRVPGAEVIAPAAEHGVQIGDDDSHVFHPGPVTSGHFLHAMSDPPPAATIRPALEEVDPLALPLPDPSAHPLPQVTAEEVEALFTPREIDSPRLVRVQFETQPGQDLADPGLSLLARSRRAAQPDKIVRVRPQCTPVA